MGSCGCGEPNGLVRLRGPGETWYGVEIYPGCRDCGSNPALAIYTMTEGEEYAWDEWEHVPVAEFNQYGMWGREVIDQTKLIAAFEEWLGADNDLDGDDEYDPPGAVHDFVREGELGRVISDTLRGTETEGRNG